MAYVGTDAQGLTAPTSKTSSAGAVANIAIPLLLSLFAKKATPDPVKQAQAQNASTLVNLPPEISSLLHTQADNSAAAAPLYRNAVSATNRLLPAWARGDAMGASSGPTGMPSPIGTPPPRTPSPLDYGGGSFGDGTESGPMIDGGTFASNSDSSPFTTTEGFTDIGGIPPKLLMMLLGLLVGQPGLGVAVGSALPKPGPPSAT